jgi:hypothetical protein
VVERDLACCGICPLQAPHQRRSRSLAGGEHQETNPCSFVWFASLCYFSSIFDLLPLRCTRVCYLCMQGSLPCLWSSTMATHQVWFVLEVKRILKLFLQVHCATPVWPVPLVNVSEWPVWPVTTTSLTDGHWQHKLSGKKSLNRSSRLFNPPLGDIKVLSIDIRARCSDSSLTASSSLMLTTREVPFEPVALDVSNHSSWRSNVLIALKVLGPTS